MSLTNPNTPVSQQDLQDFYHKILPYMGGSSEGGGGHTIEDAEGTDLTQRDTLQFGEGLSATDDSTNEKTVVDIDPMPAEDMDDVIDELPTGGNIAVTGYVPLATIIQYYGETPPDFFLACDGATYNKADYPELAKHLLSLTNNTPYIVEGDNTKFKVPDLRGEFIRGTGTNSHYNYNTDIKEGDGAAVGVHQAATVVNAGFAYAGSTNTGKITIRGNANSDGNLSLLQNVDAHKLADGSATYKQVMAPAGTVQNSPSTTVQYGTVKPTNTSVLFCIAYKDIYSNPMNDYSTTEKVVGTWVSGKPIYQKTIDFGALPNNTTKSVAHGISNLDFIVELCGSAKRPSDNTYIKLPDSPGQDLYVQGANLVVGTNSNKSGYTSTYITIQYTKTSD